MVKNLAVTKDNNGNNLILGKDYFYPNNDVNNVPIYGLLYSWEAAMKIVPDGWHIPTRKEWRKLKESLKLWKDDFLRSNYLSDYDEKGKLDESLCHDGYSETKVLAYTDYWIESDYWLPCPGKDMKSNNFSGFSAVPAGEAYIDKEGIVTFERFGKFANFWSSTPDPCEVYKDCIHYFCIGWNGPFVLSNQSAHKKNWGFSVRCIRNR